MGSLALPLPYFTWLLCLFVPDLGPRKLRPHASLDSGVAVSSGPFLSPPHEPLQLLLQMVRHGDPKITC